MALSDNERIVLADLERDFAPGPGTIPAGAALYRRRARALARSATAALAVVLVVIGVGHGAVGVALAAAGYLAAVAALTSLVRHRHPGAVGAARRRPALSLLRRYAPGPDGAC